MKKGYGKIKGGAFERQICRKLSLWISGGKSKDLMWRSAMSGGRATIARKKGESNQEQVLDLSAISAEGARLLDKCCVECKFYKQLGLLRFYAGLPSDITDFWNETVEAAKYADKIPVLVAKQNYFPEMIITTKLFYSKLLVPIKPFDSTFISKFKTVVGVFDDFLQCFVLKPEDFNESR